MKHPIPQQSFLVTKQKFNSLSSYPLSMEKGRKSTKAKLNNKSSQRKPNQTAIVSPDPNQTGYVIRCTVVSMLNQTGFQQIKFYFIFFKIQKLKPLALYHIVIAEETELK